MAVQEICAPGGGSAMLDSDRLDGTSGNVRHHIAAASDSECGVDDDADSTTTRIRRRCGVDDDAETTTTTTVPRRRLARGYIFSFFCLLGSGA